VGVFLLFRISPQCFPILASAIIDTPESLSLGAASSMTFLIWENLYRIQWPDNRDPPDITGILSTLEGMTGKRLEPPPRIDAWRSKNRDAV
jgi:hypothetical protein